NGGTPVTQTFTVNLDLDEEETFTLNSMTLKSGENQITLTINNPNGLPDSAPANNTITFNSYLDQSTDASPLRMTFDNPLEVPWIMATPASTAQDWETISTTKKLSASYRAFSNTVLGEESWLVSPVLDLTRYNEQSLFFDLSYAQKIPKEDRLMILASTDCGVTYDKVLFDETGDVFKDSVLFSAWVPPSSKYWSRERVSIDTISGKSNVRLAFVAVNANGNNIYLDNIEIFAGDDPNPPVSSLSYQFYYPPDKPQYNVALTFTLQEKKDVRLQILSIMGQVVTDTSLPDTLNQTYYFDLSTQTAGIYLFRLQIDDQFSTTKVFVGH
ncbi:MAG TPA: choice-of-anchor J domain-containing protein, partial [Cyclobacteriaceae bacterium]|nr:choice-of-anchor J domain-containing protein [Cyclobacteriaceae bacterium]